MYRIDNSSAVLTLDPPTAPGVQPNSFFTGGNPATGIEATIVEAEWLNMLQEEVGYVVTNAGIVLAKSDRTQLDQAIRRLISANALGFTPVQQGGGANQLTNKIYLGWDGGSIRAQVDSTDEGPLVLVSNYSRSEGSVSNPGGPPANWTRRQPDGYIEQGGFLDINPGVLNEIHAFNTPFARLIYQCTIQMETDASPSTTTGGIFICAAGLVSGYSSLTNFAVTNTNPAGAAQGCFWYASGY